MTHIPEVSPVSSDKAEHSTMIGGWNKFCYLVMSFILQGGKMYLKLVLLITFTNFMPEEIMLPRLKGQK